MWFSRQFDGHLTFVHGFLFQGQTQIVLPKFGLAETLLAFHFMAAATLLLRIFGSFSQSVISSISSSGLVSQYRRLQ